MNLEHLQQSIVSFRDHREWRQYHSLDVLVNSLLTELGELAYHFQFWDQQSLDSHAEEHMEDVSDELVDVLAWVLLIAHDFNVDVRALQWSPTKLITTIPVYRYIVLKMGVAVGSLANSAVESNGDHHGITEAVTEFINWNLLLFALLGLNVHTEFARKMAKNELKYPLSDK